MGNNPYKINIGKRVLIDIIYAVVSFLMITIVYLIIFFIEGMYNSTVTSVISIFFVILILGYLIFINGIKILYKVIYYSTLEFSMDSDNFVFRGGIISRFEKSLPYSKVQHVIIYKSFWQRVFGLASVSIQTAREGGMNSGYNMNNSRNRNLGMMTGPFIPDLTKEDAEKLKDFIISKSSKFKSIAGI